MTSFFHYLRDSVRELKLVTWPDQQELLRQTSATIVGVGISAFLLAIVDFLFMRGYQFLLTLAS